MDNLRAAGVDNLGLLTEQMQDKTQRAAATATAGRGSRITILRSNLMAMAVGGSAAVRKPTST